MTGSVCPSAENKRSSRRPPGGSVVQSDGTPVPSLWKPTDTDNMTPLSRCEAFLDNTV